MHRIYKYNLEPTNTNNFTMPKSAEILSIQMQNGNICMWALCHITEPQELEVRAFVIHGTGHDIESLGKYIGTIQNGVYVWHIFELSNTTN